jgi:TolB-like protein/tetratricopeptide (TPR) repeat protein
MGVGQPVDLAKNQRILPEAVETDPVRNDAIRQALERVVSSSGFARNERLSGFLRFLVERHLEGRDTELKESVIAHELFGRQADYDPKLDAIVRTEAVRLRARLEKYYQADGNQDPWIIDLPKGGYRPVVRQRLAVEPATDIPPGRPERAARLSRIRWAARAAALVLVAIAAVWWWTRPSRQALTIAVLPLENQGGPANEYFADGLTDDIIRNLSLIDGVTVPSRTSSFAVKGKGLSLAESGRQLGADYLVEGSVLHAGDQLRITVALVRARDEHRLWSDRFDRTLTDVFAIQDEISHGIVNTLRLNLSPGRRRYETNLEAYDLYLRGRHLMASFPAPGRQIALPAVKYFEQAIAKDGNYAIAYAGMADALLAMERNVGMANAFGATILSRARAAADRAIKLDPMLSEGHSAVASIRAREYAWQEAEHGFRRAIELNPNNALAHLELGKSVLTVQGRFDEGLREARRALALDPLSPYVNTEVGEALILAGRYGGSVDQLQKASAMDRSRTRPYHLLGRALTLHGKPDEALKAFDETIKRGGTSPEWRACAEVRAGRRDEALSILQQQLSAARPSRHLARTYACLGDEERALEHLNKWFTQNEPGLAEALQAPEFTAMRTNPRVAELRKQVNLTP